MQMNILKQVPFVGQSSYKEEYRPYTKRSVHNPEEENYTLPLNSA